MNELRFAEETDGMDEWYQDDESWWSDQTWLQAAQVWNETWVTGMRADITTY